MPFHPQKSREAHTEIGSRLYAAASSSSRPQDSLSRGLCDLRGSQLAVGDDGATASQPFKVLRPHRLATPVRPTTVERRSLAARLNGPARHLVIEPVPAHDHDHPTARLMVVLIALALIIVGVAVQFA